MKIWEKWKVKYEEEAQLREQERERTAQIAQGMEQRLEQLRNWLDELREQKKDLQKYLKHYKEEAYRLEKVIDSLAHDAQDRASEALAEMRGGPALPR